MYQELWPWIQMLGRILFSVLFIVGGLSHFMKREALVGYATARKAPAPAITVPLTGVMILVGGVLILLGWHRFIGAGLIVIFLAWSSFFIHSFWKDTDPTIREMEMTHFMKDVALAGGALFIAAYSGAEWTWSLGG